MTAQLFAAKRHQGDNARMALEVMGTKIALKIPDLASLVVAESIHGEWANVPTKIHSTLRKKTGVVYIPYKKLG